MQAREGRQADPSRRATDARHDMMTDIEYRTSGRRVQATAQGEEVGRIAVPDIVFHWGDGISISLAGIADVRTDQRFRRRGIASGMMRQAVGFARQAGYGASAVSTGSENTARRLYSRAGYVHLFRVWCFSRQIEARQDIEVPSDFSIRPYQDEDMPDVLGLIQETKSPFFGSRRTMPEEWAAARSGADGGEPALAFVAVRGGEVIGFADRFLHWHARTSEIIVRTGDGQFRVGDALVAALEQAAASIGEAGRRTARTSRSACCATEATGRMARESSCSTSSRSSGLWRI